MTNLQQLKQWIRESKSAVFFGGAGVSTESGIPDFRSKDGLYNQKYKFPPEYMLSHECFVDRTEDFFEFYRDKILAYEAKPNAAHRFLAQLEQAGRLGAVVTQNIDGLHQAAGSKTVYEIHGSTLRNYCSSCGKVFDKDFIFDCPDPIPRCDCGGIVRCDVTLYQELLPEDAVENAVRAISKADMLIIGGTSLTVYPAASYVHYFKGKHLVIINKDRLSYPLDEDKDLQINRPIGEVFSQL